MRETWLKYVRHEDVQPMQEEGWTVVDSMYDNHHGFYACIMEWTGEGEPANEPRQEDR